MLYREVGQFKTSYDRDQAIFPIAQDRWFVGFVIAFAFLGVPLIANQYLYTEVLIPVLILSLAGRPVLWTAGGDPGPQGGPFGECQCAVPVDGAQ